LAVNQPVGKITVAQIKREPERVEARSGHVLDRAGACGRQRERNTEVARAARISPSACMHDHAGRHRHRHVLPSWPRVRVVRPSMLMATRWRSRIFRATGPIGVCGRCPGPRAGVGIVVEHAGTRRLGQGPQTRWWRITVMGCSGVACIVAVCLLL
jgi:hypothetical protein